MERTCGRGRIRGSVMTAKPLNIGPRRLRLHGSCHSNAFLQAPRYFFSCRQPVLKAVAARNRGRAEAFAANWGYQSVETDGDGSSSARTSI